MAHAEVKRKFSEAMLHVQFCIQLCHEQHANGRVIVFKHPAGAASWCMQAIQQLHKLEGVHVVKFDFCMLGMLDTDRQCNQAAAKKRTAMMNNFLAVATLLREAQCRAEHLHAPLLDGKAGPCQQYPDQFRGLICEGVKREKDTRQWRDTVGRRNQLLACSHQWRAEVPPKSDVSTAFSQVLASQGSMEKVTTPPKEATMDQIYSDVAFIDDVTGRALDKSMAIEARKKELQYFKAKGVTPRRDASQA